MPVIPKSDEDYLEEPDDQQSQLDEEADDSDAVGLLSKAVLMGKPAKVGDKLVLEITAIHDDQIAVKYPGEEAPAKEEEEAPPAEEAAPPEGEMPVEPPVADENY